MREPEIKEIIKSNNVEQEPLLALLEINYCFVYEVSFKLPTEDLATHISDAIYQ